MERILKLRELINYYDHSYYNLSIPQISDEQYDLLFKELQDLEKQYPTMFDVNSPTQRVGEKLTGKHKTVKHEVLMPSLANTYNVDEIRQFCENILKQFPEASFVCQDKDDGAAVKLIYKQGELFQAITRGDSYEGDDVTAVIKTIRNLPLSLPIKEDLTVAGEVVMTFADFEKLEGDYKNERAAANGILKLKNPKEARDKHLTISIHSIVGTKYAKNSMFDVLTDLAAYNLPINKPFVTKNIDTIIRYYLEKQENRSQYPHPIDGIVIKVNELNICEELGTTGRSPNYARAGKFKAQQAITEVLSIEYNTGRTGKVTPKAHIKPIDLQGATMSKATLNSFDFMTELGLTVGCKVEIERGGEIIPKITRVTEHGTEPYIFTDTCPSCGSKLEIEGKHKYCRNTNCPAQFIERAINFCSRKGMNIETLGEEKIKFLIENNFVNSLGDFYNFVTNTDLQNKLMECEGWGYVSVSNMVQELKNSKQRPFTAVLYAVGIPKLGEETAKILVETFGDFQTLYNAKLSEFPLGEKTSKEIYEGLKNMNYSDIIALQRFGCQLKHIRTTEKPEKQPLKGKSIVVSGVFDDFERDTLKQMIKDYGGKCPSGVSKKLNYLLAGKNAGSSKLQNCKEFGIKIISIEDFLQMLED